MRPETVGGLVLKELEGSPTEAKGKKGFRNRLIPVKSSGLRPGDLIFP